MITHMCMIVYKKKVNFSTTRVNTVSAALIYSWCITDIATVVPVLKYVRTCIKF